MYCISHYIDSLGMPKHTKSPYLDAYTMYIASIYHCLDAYCGLKQSNCPKTYAYTLFNPSIFQ